MTRRNKVAQAHSYIFILFISSWSILVCGYSIISSYIYRKAYSRVYYLGLNVISVILWFAGSLIICRDLPMRYSDLLVSRAIYASTIIGVVIWVAFFLTICEPTEILVE